MGGQTMKVRYHFSEPSSVLVKLHGGHRIQGKIKAILGFDPQIHSGFAGKGKVMAYLTLEEMNRLTEMGFKLSRPIRRG